MMENSILWLIKLTTAYLLTSFWLRSAIGPTLMQEKYSVWGYSILYSMINAFIYYWFICFDSIWVPLVILAIELIVSAMRKSHMGEQYGQLLLPISIIGMWLFKFPEALQYTNGVFQTCLNTASFWIIGITIVFLTHPVGILIGRLTKPFRSKVENHHESSLENAGIWIGILERQFIFFLVLINQYEAIGLLIAAKSIIRLKEGEQKMSEYVLIGTLMSVLVAVVAGFIASKVLQKYGSI